MYIWFARFVSIVNLTVTLRPWPVLHTSIKTGCTLFVACPSNTPRTTCYITRVSIPSRCASLYTGTTALVTDSSDTIYWTLWNACISPVTRLTAVTMSIIHNTIWLFAICRAFEITGREPPVSVYASIGTVSNAITDIISASCLTS